MNCHRLASFPSPLERPLRLPSADDRQTANRLQRRPSCFIAFLLASALCVFPHCTSRFTKLEANTAWVESSETLFFLGIPPNAGWLFSVRFDGVDLRRLGSGPIHEYVLSSDGDWLAVVYRDGRCGIINTASREETLVPLPCRSADWDPSGVHVLLTSTDGALCVYDREKGLLGDALRTRNILGEPRWSAQGGQFQYCEMIENRCYTVRHEAGILHVKGQFPGPLNSSHDVLGAEALHFNQYSNGRSGSMRRVSPTGRSVAFSREGSLWVSGGDGQNGIVLLPETSHLPSEFGPDWPGGPEGFMNPYWSADERYVLGDTDGRVIIVDSLTGRSGIVASGTHPLVWWPRYHPAVGKGSNVLFYSAIKDAGY